MKPIAACLAALLLLLLSISALGADADEPPYLVALGDSITTGYELPGGRYGSANYVNLTAQYLSLSADGYANFAVNGYHADDLLALLPDYRDEIARADILVFDIGYNDILGSLYGAMCRAMGDDYYLSEIASAFARMPETDREAVMRALPSVDTDPFFRALYGQFEGDLHAVLDTLRDYAPDARIYMQSIYNPLAALGVFSDFSNGAVEKLNSILKDTAGKYDCGFLDVYGAFTSHESEYTYMSRWDIHPNEAGHRVIFELFSAALYADGYAPPQPQETAAPISSETEEAEPAAPAGSAAPANSRLPYLALLALPVFAAVYFLFRMNSRRTS